MPGENYPVAPQVALVELRGAPDSPRTRRTPDGWVEVTNERWLPSYLAAGVVEKRGDEFWITNWEKYLACEDEVIDRERAEAPVLGDFARLLFIVVSTVGPIVAEILVASFAGWSWGVAAGLTAAAAAIVPVAVAMGVFENDDLLLFGGALLAGGAAVVVLYLFGALRFGWLWASLALTGLVACAVGAHWVQWRLTVNR